MLVLPERERTKKGAIGVETKGVTCKIPLDLHNQISEEIRETESTMSKFIEMIIREHYEKGANRIMEKGSVPFPVSWTVKMKKKQKETQDILSYHTQAAGCSDKARAKASGGRQPIEECGRTGL